MSYEIKQHQMKEILPDGTVNFLYPITRTEDIMDGKKRTLETIIDDGKTKTINTTVLHSGWKNKQYTIPITGLSDASICHVSTPTTLTKQQRDVYGAATISLSSSGNNLILTAENVVPTIDLPIMVVIMTDIRYETK